MDSLRVTEDMVNFAEYNGIHLVGGNDASVKAKYLSQCLSDSELFALRSAYLKFKIKELGLDKETNR